MKHAINPFYIHILLQVNGGNQSMGNLSNDSALQRKKTVKFTKAAVVASFSQNYSGHYKRL